MKFLKNNKGFAIALLALLVVSSVYAQSVVRLGRPAYNVELAERSSLTYSARNYTGTGSFQPIGIDLNLGAAAGGTTGKFLSPVMGNIFGTNLSKAGNYIGGGIFHYNIAGTNATTYPSGAVLGGIGDGTTTAKCAFCAYIDGDSALTTAGAAFKVMSNNSTSGSKFNFGVDLYDAARDGYNAVSYTTADMRFSNGVTLKSSDIADGQCVKRVGNQIVGATCGGASYLVYTAILTQSGTNAPVATVMENTLGGTVVWTRSDVGDYIGTLNGAFTANKTVVFTGHDAREVNALWVSANTVEVQTFSSGTPSDDMMFTQAIEIRVYP